MALPLTVKTETVLANHLRYLPNQDIGIRLKGPDLPIQIDDPVRRRDLEAMTTLTDLEATHDGSKSIMRMNLQAINAAPKCPMMI
jgi:hypothetical protein